MVQISDYVIEFNGNICTFLNGGRVALFFVVVGVFIN